MWKAAPAGLMNSTTVDVSVERSSHYWKSIFRASGFVIALLSQLLFVMWNCEKTFSSEIVARRQTSKKGGERQTF